MTKLEFDALLARLDEIEAQVKEEQRKWERYWKRGQYGHSAILENTLALIAAVRALLDRHAAEIAKWRACMESVLDWIEVRHDVAPLHAMVRKALKEEK